MAVWQLAIINIISVRTETVEQLIEIGNPSTAKTQTSYLLGFYGEVPMFLSLGLNPFTGLG